MPFQLHENLEIIVPMHFQILYSLTAILHIFRKANQDVLVQSLYLSFFAIFLFSTVNHTIHMFFDISLEPISF